MLMETGEITQVTSTLLPLDLKCLDVFSLSGDVSEAFGQTAAETQAINAHLHGTV